LRRRVFEGDAAVMELRSRLAETRDGAVPPAPVRSPRPALVAVLRYLGIVLTASGAAGAAGYLLSGARMAFQSAQVSPPRADQPASLMLAVRTAAADAAPAPASVATGNRRTDGTGASAPAAMSLPADSSEAVERLKLGAKLIADGDVASARTMFERVAELGDAAGAFALAETYDPAVLGTMRLHGGIAPDAALARRWYEQARDMGSSAAPERIARLAGRREN
jgi:hypothetical protein